MKKNILFLFLLSCTMAVAQNSYYWQQTFGGPGVEAGYGVRSCLDQGYIVVGTSASAGPSDGYIVRTDSIGLVMWAKFYGGANIDIIRAVELLPDSGFIMAGYTNSFGNGGYDGWLLRTDKNGDTLWTKTIGTGDWDFFYDVHVTADSGFLCAGGTYGAGAGDEDMYMVKLNSSGDTLWTRTYGGIMQDEARGVVETEDLRLGLAGFTYSLSDTLGDSWLLRLESNGDTIWTRTYGDTAAEDKAYGLTYDTTLKVLLYCGYSKSTGSGDGYFQGIFYDDTTWLTINATGANFEEFYSIKAGPLCYPVAAAGTTFTYGGGQGDMFMFSTYGSWITTSFGTIFEDHAYDIDLTHDGGYVLCGTTRGFNSIATADQMYLVKTDTNAYSPSIVSVPEIAESGTRTAVSAFPVPADDHLDLTILTSGYNSTFSLTVYNSLGEVVSVVPSSEFVHADAHHANVRVETGTFAPGIYLYVLNSETETLYADQFIIAR